MFAGAMQVKDYVCYRAMQVKDYVCWSYAGKDANTEHLRQFSLILIQFRGKIFLNTLSRIGTKKTFNIIFRYLLLLTLYLSFLFQEFGKFDSVWVSTDHSGKRVS